MNNKRNVLLIVIIVLFISTVGSTYAYFVPQDNENDQEVLFDEYYNEPGFSGTIYRNNNIVAFNYQPMDNTKTNGWCYKDNGEIDCIYPTATRKVCENDGITCEEQLVTVGVGRYEKNKDIIINKKYNIYCPINGTEKCTNKEYYSTEQDCLNYMNDECMNGTITKPFYLKHDINNNVIESTSVCLWLNNKEFCLKPNYWLTNEEDTKLKLRKEMESSLGILADDCYSDSFYVECHIGSFYCDAESNGTVSCDDNISYCEVNSDGTSTCY